LGTTTVALINQGELLDMNDMERCGERTGKVVFMVLVLAFAACANSCGTESPMPASLDASKSEAPRPADVEAEQPTLLDDAADEVAPVTELVVQDLSTHDEAGPLPDICVPKCQGKFCGDDGCGATCGQCRDNEECLAGMCICQPLCDTIECGVDGCGGSCGDCAPTESCKAGKCVCEPTCGLAKCGDAGCGGSCGECGDEETCEEGFCKSLFGALGDPCAYGEECGSGLCLSSDQGKICTEHCIGPECPGGFSCQIIPIAGDEELQVCMPCTADCVGKLCGSDGCGGICGVCEVDEYCNIGKCATLGGKFGENCAYGSDCGTGLCIAYDEGKICTVACGDSEDCPLGYWCQIIGTGGGGTLKVCLP